MVKKRREKDEKPQVRTINQIPIRDLARKARAGPKINDEEKKDEDPVSNARLKEFNARGAPGKNECQGQEIQIFKFPSGGEEKNKNNRLGRSRQLEKELILKKIEMYDSENEKSRNSSTERIKVSEIAKDLIDTTKSQVNRSNVIQLLRDGSLSRRKEAPSAFLKEKPKLISFNQKP